MNTFDEFAETLFNEAKYFLEQSQNLNLNEQIKFTYLHSSLLLGMSSLEAYVNAISNELIKGFPLDLNEKAFLDEKDIVFGNGIFTLGKKLKMYRLIDRIELIYCKYSSKSITESDAWFSAIKQTINHRNKLVHPKEQVQITNNQLELALNSILDTIDALYLAVYKTHVPILNLGLQSTLDI